MQLSLEQFIPSFESMKKCKVCGELKHIDQFNKHKRYKDGLQEECRDCNKKYKREYYLKNKERLLNEHKEYNKNNKEKISKKQKEYNEKNKEQISKIQKEYAIINNEKIVEYRKEYRAKNRERLCANNREYAKRTKDARKKYRSENADRLLKYAREYKSIHREEIKEYAIKYREENKERLLAHGREYNKLNREKRRQYDRENKHKREEYYRSDRGFRVLRKHRLKRRGLGFNPVNKFFPNSNYHHLRYDANGDVDNNIGIFIPEELHKSVYHNGFTGYGMEEINKLAIEWYLSTCNSNTEELQKLGFNSIEEFVERYKPKEDS